MNPNPCNTRDTPLLPLKVANSWPFSNTITAEATCTDVSLRVIRKDDSDGDSSWPTKKKNDKSHSYALHRYLQFIISRLYKFKHLYTI